MGKISTLPQITTDPSGGMVPIVINGVTKRIDASKIGNNGFVNVGNYGVSSGGSSTANATGLLAALAAAASAGKDVFCPFSFTTDQVTITQSNIKIFGRGPSSAITLKAATYPPNSPFFLIHGTNVVFEDLCIDGGASNFAANASTKGIYTERPGTRANRVNFINLFMAFQGGYVAPVSGAIFMQNLVVNECTGDNIGGQFCAFYYGDGITITNNIVKSWAAKQQDISCIEFYSASDGYCRNILIQGNRISNPNNSTKFFIETPGTNKNLQNVQIINEVYDGGGFTTGGFSMGLNNAQIINPTFINFGAYAYGVESSGNDISLIGGNYGNGLVRLGPYVESIAKNILISGVTWNLTTSAADYDTVVAIGGPDSAGGNTGIVNGLRIQNCIVNAQLAKANAIFVIGNYGGKTVTINDAIISGNHVIASTPKLPVCIYLTGNGGNRITIQDNNFELVGNGIFTDAGTWNKLRIMGNVCSGQMIHSSITQSTAPGYYDGSNNLAPNSLSIFNGLGSPETVITAAPGSLYLRRDGAANTTLYVKESGSSNTGWVAK
jgi:hypothetical protein